MDVPLDFDMSAAWIRRAQADGGRFLEVMASRLEEALPGRVDVERRRDGLFAKTTHVDRLTIRMDNVYTLQRDGGDLGATVARMVRGVAISTKRVPLPEWVTGLDAELRSLAAAGSDAGSVLHALLAS